MVKGWAKGPQGKIQKGEMNGKLRTPFRTVLQHLLGHWYSTYKLKNLNFRFSISQSFQTSWSKSES